MFDDRHLSKHYDIEQQLCWTFLVDTICNQYWETGGRKKKKQDHDFPLAVGLWANKYDLWKDKYPHKGKIEDHPIFESFKPGLQRLNDAVVSHVAEVSFRKYRISRLVLNWKVDPRG